MSVTSDRIEKSVSIQASLERVWNALVDHQQFGEWFRVKLEGPFRVGHSTYGQITYPGYEHLRWEAAVIAMEPMKRFAFTWHPYAIDTENDYSNEPPTTVEFSLQQLDDSVVVTVVESGFDAIPESRRDLAFRMNEGGWAAQMKNISQYVHNH